MARAGSPTPSPGSASAPAARQCSPAWSRSPGGARFAPPLPLPGGLSRQHGQWMRPLLSGVAYVVASLGCSLPVFLAFLAFLASSLSVRGSGNAIAVLAAYVAGIATTILALLVVATLLRE